MTIRQANKEWFLLIEQIENNKSLASLDLNNCNIDDDGAIALAAALKNNNSTERLFLSNNKICNAGAKALSSVILINPHITILYLNNNQISDEGANYIGSALKENQSLYELELRSNCISEKGFYSLSANLKSNLVITSLKLNGNPVERLGVKIDESINPYLVRNQKLRETLNDAIKKRDISGVKQLTERGLGLLSKSKINSGDQIAIKKALKDHKNLKHSNNSNDLISIAFSKEEDACVFTQKLLEIGFGNFHNPTQMKQRREISEENKINQYLVELSSYEYAALIHDKSIIPLELALTLNELPIAAYLVDAMTKRKISISKSLSERYHLLLKQKSLLLAQADLEPENELKKWKLRIEYLFHLTLDANDDLTNFQLASDECIAYRKLLDNLQSPLKELRSIFYNTNYAHKTARIKSRWQECRVIIDSAYHHLPSGSPLKAIVKEFVDCFEMVLPPPLYTERRKEERRNLKDLFNQISLLIPSTKKTKMGNVFLIYSRFNKLQVSRAKLLIEHLKKISIPLVEEASFTKEYDLLEAIKQCQLIIIIETDCLATKLNEDVNRLVKKEIEVIKSLNNIQITRLVFEKSAKNPELSFLDQYLTRDFTELRFTPYPISELIDFLRYLFKLYYSEQMENFHLTVQRFTSPKILKKSNNNANSKTHQSTINLQEHNTKQSSLYQFDITNIGEAIKDELILTEDLPASGWKTSKEAQTRTNMNIADTQEAIELTLYKIGIEKIGESIENAVILAEALPEGAYKNQFLVFIDNYKKAYEALQQKISKAQPKESFLEDIKKAATDFHKTLQQKLRNLSSSTQSGQEVIMLSPVLEEVVNVFAFVAPKSNSKLPVNNYPPEILQTKKWVMQACFEATARKLALIFKQRPSLFLSYSWTNPGVVQLVRRIAKDLKRSGSDIFMDVWQNTLVTGIPAFIKKIANEKEVTGIMLMGSPELVEKYLDADSMIKLEQDLIFARYKNNANCVIPVLISGEPHEAFPGFLGGSATRAFTGFTDQDIYDLGTEEHYYENLCRIISRLADMTFPGKRFADQRQQVQLLFEDLLEKLQFIKANRLSSEALMQLYMKYQQAMQVQIDNLFRQIMEDSNAFIPNAAEFNYFTIDASLQRYDRSANENNNNNNASSFLSSSQTAVNAVVVPQNVTTAQADDVEEEIDFEVSQRF